MTARTFVMPAAFLLTAVLFPHAGSGAPAAPVDPFFKEHCIRCHGPEKSKGDLRIDQLDADLSKPEAFDHWREIVQRIESGDMPPKKEPRPPATQVATIVGKLSDQLDAAVAVKRKAEGRVVLRRLNRVEYENTVRDLFAVSASVKDTLPPDASAKGFDNVGAALQMSPVQMERYLQAADQVFTSALTPVHKVQSSTQRLQLEMPAWIGSWKQDDGVVLFRNRDGGAHDLRAFKAPAAGRYRFKIRASALNSKTPLTMAVLLGNFVVKAESINRFYGYFDVPPGEPTTIEFEERLAAKNDTIMVVPSGLPRVYLRKETYAEYPGPGLKIHWIEIEGPFPETWPTESYRRVIGDGDAKTGKLADAEKVLRALLPRAFRQPMAEEDLKPFLAIAAEALQKGQTYEAAMRSTIKAVLASPEFLYLREPAGPLDDYAVASRLSYFLWSSMPDATLFDLAKKGQLRKPQVLREQVERMLKDPKASQFTENFTGQWLGLRDIDATSPDKALYPEFDEYLQWSSVRETHLFFEEILKSDLSVKNFVDSDFAIINGRLAELYGMPDVIGGNFRKVKLKPEQHRGGVITQASVLKVTANGTNTSPVLRGVWIQDRILGRPVPPPPPNVPAIEPDIRGAKTIREILGKHRESESCAACHARIDPAGFALENYDVIGGWRDRYRTIGDPKNKVDNRKGSPLGKYLAAYQYGLGLPVSAGDTLPDGRKFADLAELKKLLLEDPDQIARNLTEKLVTYATGQPVDFGDHAAVRKILDQSKQSDYGLRSIVHAIVQSDLFLNK